MEIIVGILHMFGTLAVLWVLMTIYEKNKEQKEKSNE